MASASPQMSRRSSPMGRPALILALLFVRAAADECPGKWNVPEEGWWASGKDASMPMCFWGPAVADHGDRRCKYQKVLKTSDFFKPPAMVNDCDEALKDAQLELVRGKHSPAYGWHYSGCAASTTTPRPRGNRQLRRGATTTSSAGSGCQRHYTLKTTPTEPGETLVTNWYKVICANGPVYRNGDTSCSEASLPKCGQQAGTPCMPVAVRQCLDMLGNDGRHDMLREKEDNECK